MRNIALLGSTGSVGRNVLETVSASPDSFNILALASGGSSWEEFAQQINRFKPRIAAISDKNVYDKVRELIEVDVELVAGEEEICRIASMEEPEIVFIAISGTSGLRPLISALTKGKTVALASKEPLISAGRIINDLRKKHSSTIIPVDSEHSALFDCLRVLQKDRIRKISITGSGGSLWGTSGKFFDEMSVEQVLSHPKWDMGPKITVDSATLMNKALEMIEARWLFDIDLERIGLIIHPEAIVHALVELSDGTVRASCFSPHMRYPIARALNWPSIPVNSAPGVDFTKLGSMTFHEPDLKRFPAIDIAMSAVSEGGSQLAVLNGANDEAVAMFLEKKIRFTDVIKSVEKVLKRHSKVEDPDLDQIIAAELWAKEEVRRLC